MKLCEIIGDNEADVYNELKTMYLVVKTYNDTPNRTTDFEILHRLHIEKLYKDTINLNYWILTSDRINKLYNEIKQLL